MTAAGAVAAFLQPVAVEGFGRIVDQWWEGNGLEARVCFNEEPEMSNFDDPFLAQAS